MAKKPKRPKTSVRKPVRSRRTYPDELKTKAVQMMLGGHSAQSVVNNLGLSSVNLLYRWKEKMLAESGPAATTLGASSLSADKQFLLKLQLLWCLIWFGSLALAID